MGEFLASMIIFIVLISLIIIAILGAGWLILAMVGKAAEELKQMGFKFKWVKTLTKDRPKSRW